MLRSNSFHAPLGALPLLLLAACGAGGDSEGGVDHGQPAVEAGAAVELRVRPGESIQAALEQAAEATAARKLVRVEAGTYRPDGPAQALVWFNARHDGIVLEAEGEVVLTAANPELADPEDESYPALVNHVVYFGDGVTPSTVLRGFRITGANHFVTEAEEPGPVQPFSPVGELRKSLFFYADGGGVKVFGRSYPTIEGCEIHDNYASPCAGGVSVEQRGFKQGVVTFRDCVFRNNRCQITGSAIDLLPGSAALIENCLFVGNVSNTGEDTISPPTEKHHAEHGSGALTVFEHSEVRVERCTFTGNWNGVDDDGRGNVYRDSIFWRNQAPGGIAPGERYELDLRDGGGVSGCFVNGALQDVRGSVDRGANVFDAPDPEFDAAFVPRAAAYAGVGYRPREAAATEGARE